MNRSPGAVLVADAGGGGVAATASPQILKRQ